MLIIAFLFSVFVLVIAGCVWNVRRRLRAPAEVRLALERAGHEVVKMQHRALRLGAFSVWNTSRTQFVFRVVVCEAGGQQRVGWARWGRRWLSDPDTFELKWDE
jgi:outer membrane lipopolysaccharide assembly protein LptE/RlpB